MGVRTLGRGTLGSEPGLPPLGLALCLVKVSLTSAPELGSAAAAASFCRVTSIEGSFDPGVDIIVLFVPSIGIDGHVAFQCDRRRRADDESEQTFFIRSGDVG